MQTSRKRFVYSSALAVLLLSSAAAAAPRTLLLDVKTTQIRFFLEATLHTVEGSAPLVEGNIQFDLERGTANGAVRIDARSHHGERNSGRHDARECAGKPAIS